MSINLIKTPIQYLKGVGPLRANLLATELNIFTIEDLFHFYPYKYTDKTKFHKINEIRPDFPYVQIIGVIKDISISGIKRNKKLKAIFEDETGQIELVWFKGIQWIEKTILIGRKFIVFGKPNLFLGNFSIIHPELEVYDNSKDYSKGIIESNYSSTENLKNKNITNKIISSIILNAFEVTKNEIFENLPENILKKYSFPSRINALFEIHFPKSIQTLNYSIERLKYEELFFIQLNLLQNKVQRKKEFNGFYFSKVGHFFNEFFNKHLSFNLTNAQKRVIKEIRKDLDKGYQMNRLLQGDVGSGKTLVAIFCMLLSIDNGFQACLMAPTEILAKQHFRSISKFLKPLNLNIHLLTGSIKTSERVLIHEDLLSGNANILIGTHALIEEDVKFKNLGLAIVDEQHRFGVAQRAKLWSKNIKPPHILVMTATPIPRTLSMTLYGDLDISIIDELPPGRKEIKTIHYYESSRLKLFSFIRSEIEKGRQVFIVYPLIKESETLDLNNLEAGFESISRAFPIPKYQIGIVHGKMKPEDKDFEMNRFLKKETQILVSTTVIEVGVDVPNASIMVIENAERFGLSQLHQLRGRVGRGAEQSYCILMSSSKLSADAKLRIQSMVKTTDGFELSEIDLKLRGPGDMHGTKQSGITDLKIADIIKDNDFLHMARKDVISLLKEDPSLDSLDNNRTKAFLIQKRKDTIGWSKIS